jgi:hypothetical protein
MFDIFFLGFQYFIAKIVFVEKSFVFNYDRLRDLDRDRDFELEENK